MQARVRFAVDAAGPGNIPPSYACLDWFCSCNECSSSIHSIIALWCSSRLTHLAFALKIKYVNTTTKSKECVFVLQCVLKIFIYTYNTHRSFALSMILQKKGEKIRRKTTTTIKKNREVNFNKLMGMKTMTMSTTTTHSIVERRWHDRDRQQQKKKMYIFFFAKRRQRCLSTLNGCLLLLL